MAKVVRIGVDEVLADLQALGGEKELLEQVGRAALEDGAAAAVEIAKATAPRRTGRFAESIAASGAEGEETGQGVAVVVGSELWYGRYVEFGTARMAARRPVGNAVDAVEGVIRDALDRRMAAYLDGLGF